MAKLYNLARMSTSTTGTGTITLGSAVSGFLSFASAGVSDGETITYAIKDGSNSEIGRGTYTASGTTLTRSVLRSTNSNSAINLSGSAQVFITPAAEDLIIMSPPGGRLTLATGVPVMVSTQSAKTTIYYTPHVHRYVPIYDGTLFTMHDIGAELSQATTDSTKSPAAVTTNSNYDLFVWNDSGTYRCTRGPAWSSSTARGTGAGTTELEQVKGVWLNKVAITNGPAANRGTYVGTVRSNGSSQIDFILGALSAGGTAGVIGVWNAYNSEPWHSTSADSADSWTYTSSTVRQANASTGMQASFITGLPQGVVTGIYSGIAATSSASAKIIVGYDSTSAIASPSSTGYNALATASQGSATYQRFAEIGWHYIAALESGGTGVTFYGDSGSPTQLQAGLFVSGSY